MAEEIIIKTVLDLSGSEQVIKRQVEKALGGRESAEDRHNRRIEALHLQSATRIQQIEARKQAQIDAIRERGIQKELEHQRKIERETQRAANAFSSMRTAIAGVAGIFTVLAGSGALSFFENLARRAIDAAVAIDRQVNTLKALTGSAEAATRRFAELFALAQKTPGLTTSLALTLDNQLRVLNVTEQTINRILPAIGRLNAIAPLGDPARFAGNLTQLITQGFERQDLKELVGNSPFAGQLIKQIFSVDSPTNAKAIRESARALGINTVEEFFTAFAQAAENNPKLQAVQESLATRFEKLQDRITVALAPVGDELLKTIIPAFTEFVELLERDLPKITAFLRENREEFLAVAGAISFMTDKVSQLIGALGKFQIAENLTITRLLSMLAIGAVGGPEAAIRAGQTFAQGDARRARLAARLPAGVSIEDAIGAIRNPVTGSSGGGAGAGGLGGGGDSEISKAAKKRAKELADARKNSAEALDVFMKGNIEDLEQISKIINEANALGEERRRQIEGRPAQLAGFNAALQERIRKNDIETLRLEENTRRAEAETIGRTGRRAFNRSGAFIDDALSRGQITAGEADALRESASRELANQLRLKEQLLAINDPLLDDLREEIELYDRLGTSISDSERFARGFNSAIESSGDIWERFGQNVSNAFRNVKDVFNGLKSAVLGFFNDLLGNSLQSLVRQTLGPIFGGAGAGGGGGIGGLFRTPSTFPGAFAQAFAGAGGAGIAAPPSVSSQVASGIFGNGQFAAGLGGGTQQQSGGVFGKIPGLNKIFGGIFNKVFAGGAVSAIPPLIGAQLGVGLGGQSTLGRILGGIGGGAVGLGAAFGSAVFGAGGGLAAAGLAALGPAALIGAPLLVGAILLGKAAQRRKDEEASGQFLTQALQGIQEVAAGVTSGQIAGSQARAIFETQIIGTFQQQIGGLKTKSVRESRLTNQVADLRRNFDDVVGPAITARDRQVADQARFAEIDRRLVPQFARGGTTGGGLAFLHPGEKILNFQQQAAVIGQSNPRVFENAGVPGPSSNRNFDIGGTMGSGGMGQPIHITFGEVALVISDKTVQGIYVRGATSDTGRAVTVDNFKQARKNREV